jgi:SAM-dependent methyltransferase
MSMSYDKNTDFAECSYRSHALHEEERSDTVPAFMARQDTVDAWAHYRIHELIEPIYSLFKDKKWLTVGDDGSGAYYLKSRGIKDIICSSISTAKLDRLTQRGYLDGIDVKTINAESINLANCSVDVVLCKQSYHHFPRPAVAVYEFIRVSRDLFILIEPNDAGNTRFLDFVRKVVMFIIRSRRPGQRLFESSGNFIYRLSLRELIKMGAALQIEAIAFKYYNDFYTRNVGKRKINEKPWLYVQKLAIIVQDVLCFLRLMNYCAIVAIVPKAGFDQVVRASLIDHGFKIVDLPRNPYFAGTRYDAKV